MNRILSFIVIFFCGLNFWATTNTMAAEPGVPKDARRPNIIFLLADDQQAFAMGCMGNTEIETPNMDKLAEKGFIFERSYATSPLCMASRATIMSGMYEFKTGCNFKTGALSERVWKQQSYPMLLKKAGYRIAFAGKWGFPIKTEEGKTYNAKGDFDKWGALLGGQGYYVTEQNPEMKAYASKYPHITRALGAFGQDFIRESADTGQPFCLSISFKAPHKPHFQIDREDQKRYAYQKFSYPEGWGIEGARKLPIQAKLGRQYLQRGEWDQHGFYQEHLKAYYQLISGVDAAIGMILETLEEQGVADNTVIIYTADNGYFLGVHGLQGKVLPYEHASRIPLIVYDPREPLKNRGRKAETLVANIDFAPTILDLADIPIPSQMDGKSLLPIIRGQQREVRQWLGLIQNWDVDNRDMTKALAVTTSEYKYIYWCYGDKNIQPVEELFNLNKDASELRNVAGQTEYRDALKEMQLLYDTFYRQWVENAVDGPYYKRYAELFDRKIPWQEKNYRTETSEKYGILLEDLYYSLTQKKYPGK